MTSENSGFTVVYRMGGSTSHEWRATVAFPTHAEAVAKAAEVQKGGRRTLVFPSSVVAAPAKGGKGLPMGYSHPAFYLGGNAWECALCRTGIEAACPCCEPPACPSCGGQARGFTVTEYAGKGDPFCGGTADDRPLGRSGVFLNESATKGFKYLRADVAHFSTRLEAEAVAASAPRRQGSKVGFSVDYGTHVVRCRWPNGRVLDWKKLNYRDVAEAAAEAARNDPALAGATVTVEEVR